MWPPEPRTIKVFAAEVRFAAFVFRFGTTHQSRAITTITKPINEAKYQVIALPSIALKCSSGARRVPATSQQKRNFKGFCEFERNKGCANKPYSTMVEFKESLQYHNFFQKIYSHGNKDDICFGMGLLVPRVPFLFQTIPEKRTQDPLELVLLTLYYNYLLLSPGAFEFLQIFDICEGDAVTVLLYFCEFVLLHDCSRGLSMWKRNRFSILRRSWKAVSKQFPENSLFELQ